MGQNLLQIGAGITNQGNYYKLENCSITKVSGIFVTLSTFPSACLLVLLGTSLKVSNQSCIGSTQLYILPRLIKWVSRTLEDVVVNPLSDNPTKWSNTQKIRRQQPTNCVIVFDHFVGLALRGLKIKYFWAALQLMRQLNSIHKKIPWFQLELCLNAPMLIMLPCQLLQSLLDPFFLSLF